MNWVSQRPVKQSQACLDKYNLSPKKERKWTEISEKTFLSWWKPLAYGLKKLKSQQPIEKFQLPSNTFYAHY